MGFGTCTMEKKAMEVEKTTESEPPKPSKRTPRSLTQLNQSLDAKKSQADAFMMRHHRRKAETMTHEEVHVKVHQMFASLDAQRGW